MRFPIGWRQSPGGEDEEDTVILHIRVAVKDHLQMAEAYHFTTEQKKATGGTDAAGV